MSKATASTSATVSVATRIGTLNFKQVNPSKYVVRCKGKDRIRLSLNKADGLWQGTMPASINGEVASGKTPELCFKRAVAKFWN